MIVRSVTLGVLALVAAAAEHIEIDQPVGWYRLDVSHHGKHALGGVAIGAVTFETASLATDDRGDRYALAVGAGLAVGVGYELIEGRDGKAWADPVDAAYVAAGALVGAALADLTDHLVEVIAHRDGAAIAIAWRF